MQSNGGIQMKVIGLTGGIASGKSTASSILKELNVPVIDADKIAREIVDVGKPALNEIKSAFGQDVMNKDGSLNRKYLGRIVFSDKEKLEILNSITHKRIREEIINRINRYREINIHPLIIIDAALLIESDMKTLVDEIWLVVVDEKIQKERLMKRDVIGEDDAMNKIKTQMTTEEKKKYANVIIDNNKDIDYLKERIKNQLGKRGDVTVDQF